jgi:hypothetical protein
LFELAVGAFGEVYSAHTTGADRFYDAVWADQCALARDGFVVDGGVIYEGVYGAAVEYVLFTCVRFEEREDFVIEFGIFPALLAEKGEPLVGASPESCLEELLHAFPAVCIHGVKNLTALSRPSRDGGFTS